MEPFKTFIKSFGHAQGIPLAFSDAARVPEEEPSMQGTTWYVFHLFFIGRQQM